MAYTWECLPPRGACENKRWLLRISKDDEDDFCKCKIFYKEVRNWHAGLTYN